MIELVLVICLQGDAMRCKEHREQLAEGVQTVQQCQQYAQPILAEIMGVHYPHWRIKSYRCLDASKKEQDA